MEEKREEVVEIEDASVEDVRQLVCYMYTGMIEDDYTRFRELLVLADLTSTKSTNGLTTATENLKEENALELDTFEEVRNVNFCFFLNDDLPSSL